MLTGDPDLQYEYNSNAKYTFDTTANKVNLTAGISNDSLEAWLKAIIMLKRSVGYNSITICATYL